jgi:hypothetical protein
MPRVPTSENLVRQQILVRDLNEHVVGVLKAQNLHLETDGDYPSDFLCECSREACTEMVSLTIEEYESVRSSPTVFAVVPGHETPAVDEILFTNERFSLVEKTVFTELAVTSDPRAGSRSGSFRSSSSEQ